MLTWETICDYILDDSVDDEIRLIGELFNFVVAMLDLQPEGYEEAFNTIRTAAIEADIEDYRELFKE